MRVRAERTPPIDSGFRSSWLSAGSCSNVPANTGSFAGPVAASKTGLNPAATALSNAA